MTDKNTLSKSVLTFGNFDGVHLGHLKLLNKVMELSKNIKSESVVVTFSPNTKQIITNDKNFKFLTSYNHKISLLNKLNIDNVCKIIFNNDFANISADNFIEKIVNKYNPTDIVLGYDNKFGKNGFGTFEYLSSSDKYKNISFHNVTPYIINNKIVKTSIIKSYILNGDIINANKYLGRNYTFKGKVVLGKKIATSMGYPTANIQINRTEQLIPKNGVYSVNLSVDGLSKTGICNIGNKPTFGFNERTIEVHLLYEDINIYDKTVSLEFNYFIRDEKKFENKTKLIEQIKLDINKVRNKETNCVE